MRLILTLALLFFSYNSFSQKYGNIWQFGLNRGLDFTSCEPVIINGSNAGYEGVSSVCDSTGQLLFYTNSDDVWNKYGNAIPNGNLTQSGGTISQVLIVKKPLSSTIYYVFTVDAQAGATQKMQYHEIDMSMNAGLGGVLSKNTIMTNAVVTEQVAATWHTNGTDFWVVTHEYGTNNFLAFLVTSAGVAASPVISSTGPAHVACVSNMNARGEIKFSPNGQKLAFNGNGVGGNTASNMLALFDFNKANGTVSNPINLPFSQGDFGLSFSPDNSKLYGTTWKAFNFPGGSLNYVYQFDLTSGNAATIIASKFIIDSTASVFSDIKIGPDGKIYISRYNNFMAVINHPNAYGNACNYVRDAIDPVGGVVQHGLNNYIEYTTYCDFQSVNEKEAAVANVYPNPASTQITVETNFLMYNATLNMYNSIGELVQTIPNVSGKSIVVKCEGLPQGMYVMTLSHEGKEITTEKIIIE